MVHIAPVQNCIFAQLHQSLVIMGIRPNLRSLGVTAGSGWKPYLNRVTVSSIPLPVAPYGMLPGTTGYENVPEAPISRYDLWASIRSPNCENMLNCFGGSEYQQNAMPGVLRSQTLDNLISLGSAPTLQEQRNTFNNMRRRLRSSTRRLQEQISLPSNDDPLVYYSSPYGNARMSYELNCGGTSQKACHRLDYEIQDRWYTIGFIYITDDEGVVRPDTYILHVADLMLKAVYDSMRMATPDVVPNPAKPEVVYEDFGDQDPVSQLIDETIGLPPSFGHRRLQTIDGDESIGEYDVANLMPLQYNEEEYDISPTDVVPEDRIELSPTFAPHSDDMEEALVRRLGPAAHNLNSQLSLDDLQKWESDWKELLYTTVMRRQSEPITETLLMENGVYDYLPYYGISTTPEWIEYGIQSSRVKDYMRTIQFE